jgi:hypothetical protein
MYVSSLSGHVTKSDLARQSGIESAIKEAKAAYPEADEGSLRDGLTSFFMEDNPDYGALKWNTAQNFYVAKALGLDPSGSLLSKEVFAGTELYLDTNVLISALEPVEAHHRLFESLGKACKNLGVKLNVCQISIDELRHVAEVNKEILRRMGDQVPEALRPKISNIFYELYWKSEERNDLESLFYKFSHPLATLRDAYGIELVDSEWFTSETFTEGTRCLVEKLRNARTFRKKPERAAQHDALLMRWLDVERKRARSKMWIVTRDRTLPGIQTEDGEPVAITLDALLQWIAPISDKDYSDLRFTEMFSESIRLQLLPPENFLDLKDFCMLVECGITCKDLPAEDVEACIRDLKAALPSIDPTEPRDREKISHRISKFFADPGRKFKERLRDLERQNAVEADGFLDRIQEKDHALSHSQELLAKSHDALLENEQRLTKTREELRAQSLLLATREREIAALRQNSLRSSADRRLAAVVVAYVVVQLSVVAAGWLYGGSNWFVKLSTACTILGGVTWLFRWLGRVIVGANRIGALGHAGRTLLGAKVDDRDRPEA